jgi:hypothetical protein
MRLWKKIGDSQTGKHWKGNKCKDAAGNRKANLLAYDLLDTDSMSHRNIWGGFVPVKTKLFVNSRWVAGDKCDTGRVFVMDFTTDIATVSANGIAVGEPNKLPNIRFGGALNPKAQITPMGKPFRWHTTAADKKKTSEAASFGVLKDFAAPGHEFVVHQVKHDYKVSIKPDLVFTLVRHDRGKRTLEEDALKVKWDVKENGEIHIAAETDFKWEDAPTAMTLYISWGFPDKGVSAFANFVKKVDPLRLNLINLTHASTLLNSKPPLGHVWQQSHDPILEARLARW